MDTLGEDLVLLSIRPDNGTIATKSRLGYGLRGSELVRLAASGRVGITGDRIVVLDGQPTGDEQLDAALASLAGARRPPRPKTWVGHPESQIVDTYLARLAATGAIRQERRTFLAFIPAVRWRIADTAPARGRPGPAGRDRPRYRPGRHRAGRLRGAGQRQRPGPGALPGDGPTASCASASSASPRVS